MSSQEPVSRDAPWSSIPPRIAGLLRPHVPALSEEVIEAIRADVPAYRRPLRGRFGTGIREGVEQALGQFADLIADPALDRAAAERVYRGLGGGEFRERRSLDALLSAYRLGARVSWRRIAALAIEAGVDRRTLALLAEAVFAYIDGLSALSAEGYAQAQSAAAGEADRRRRRLARLLLDPSTEPDELARVAGEAGWRQPETIAALVWAERPGRVRSRLPAEALVLDEAGGAIALVPDPGAPGLAAALARAAAGGLAVLGPAVAPAAAPGSARRARAVLELAERGIVAADGLIDAADHLAALATHGEPAVLEELARARLEPLDSETAASRARLLETLRSWLDHQGEVAAVAAELEIHPQTVRYRLARLRDAFGDALERPDARFELALALRGADAGA